MAKTQEELNYEEEKSVIKDETETQNMDRVLLSDDVMEQINGGVKAPDFLALK